MRTALALAPLSRSLNLTRVIGEQSTRPWLAAASKADIWLRSASRATPAGVTWPVDASSPAGIRTDLYTGMAGIVLFYLELHNATGDTDALDIARRGADELLATLPDDSAAQMGLYTGVAGIAVVLAHAYRATRDERYRVGTGRAIALLVRATRRTDAGVSWNDSTDIVSGSAGIGLALLALEPLAPREADVRSLVAGTGTALVREALDTGGRGLTWLIQPSMPRNYPNFSHGTAGVSTFLARAGARTGRRDLLDAALAGERWLRGLMSSTPGGGRVIYHSTPGNEALFYLSWCHGPAGTARLYRTLADVTGDAAWDHFVPRLAAGIEDMKVPERSPGFWNNVSQCCGNCGVSEFFVALHRRSGDPRHLEFAERVAHDTLARATTEGDGLKWVQAEHRVRPDEVVAQTGLMQGAAGVGLALLHLDGAREGRAPFVRLPDEAL
jgi:lantibiotic modifying enzyme